MADRPKEAVRSGYIMHTIHGSYCTVCQSPLGCEEMDWDECDTCGGEGLWPEAEDDDDLDAKPGIEVREIRRG